LQVDFFRGLALVVIFVNHMPGNPWTWYTPSRLGPSDAAEIFVFLSGYAAAIAYGRSFGRAGVGLGSAAVLFRCAQIYVAQLALFFAVAALFAFATVFGVSQFDWQFEGLRFFFDRTQEALPALLGLRYVPNYIDILPMYLVVMLWLPLVWVLSRIHVALALAFSAALYVAAAVFGWELSADPLTGRNWFFNPFFWQLLFFTGFAFGGGWIAVPRWRLSFAIACAVFLVFCYPLDNAFGYRHLPWFATLREQWAPALDKSHLGLLRYAHFLALAYVVGHVTAAHCGWMKSAIARGFIALGQQSLPIFMLGTVLSFAGGMLLGPGESGLAYGGAITVAGVLLMIALARLLSWLDAKPWKSAVARSCATLPMRTVWRSAIAFALLLLAGAPMYFLQSNGEPQARGALQAAGELQTGELRTSGELQENGESSGAFLTVRTDAASIDAPAAVLTPAEYQPHDELDVDTL